jgi:hypothetical protein
VDEAGKADHVAGLERAAGEPVEVLDGAELSRELHGHMTVVHDEELDLDGLLHVLVEGTVERDNRVPAAQGRPVAEGEEHVVGVVADERVVVRRVELAEVRAECRRVHVVSHVPPWEWSLEVSPHLKAARAAYRPW